MVKEFSSKLQSSSMEDDLHKIYFTLYHPEDLTTVKATLLILHGMQEHSGRYTDFARYLAEQGIAVLTYDHLGHGKTAETNENLGYFYDNNPRRQVIIDAENMAAYLENKFAFVPHFVFGHSMGSFMTRCLLQVAQQRFDGAIICGTGGRMVGIKVGRSILSFLNKLAPRKRSSMINSTFVKLNNVRFKNEKPQHGTNWLSKNEENRLAFLKDPLCGVPFTYNGFYTLLSLVDDATKRNWAKNLIRRFPFYFIAGIDDPIGDYGKGVKQTVDQLKADGFTNVEMKLYDDMRHEIMNEIDKELVYKDVLNWIEKHLA